MPRWAIVLMVVTGALCVLVPVGGVVAYVYASGRNHEDLRFPSEDVTVARCAPDPASGRPVAELSVTSRAARTGTYTVTVEFLDARGEPVGRGVGKVAGLAAGATGRTVVSGPAPASGSAAGSGGDGAAAGGERAAERAAPRCDVYDVGFLAVGEEGP
ncbi:hypothetical protein ACFY9C_11305 [Streptomyces filamentosus]|uniref:hypothetical protein n=1 Tax=Streptomyces filamentosus TaxID=67294 RepID=UPI0036EF1846